MTDPLSASAVFGSVSASQGSCTRTVSAPNKNKDGTVICSLGTVTNTTPATVTIMVTPTKPGTLANPSPATVTATNVSPADSDHSATATVTVHGG